MAGHVVRLKEHRVAFDSTAEEAVTAQVRAGAG